MYLLKIIRKEKYPAYQKLFTSLEIFWKCALYDSYQVFLHLLLFKNSLQVLS